MAPPARPRSAFARYIASLGSAVRAVLYRIAWLNNWLLLTIVFIVLVVPYGMFARWRRRLRYVTGFDRQSHSYRIRRTAEETAVHLERPF